MAHSWLIYATVSRAVAEGAVAAMYELLGGIVGKDLAEHLDPGEDLEPPVLGFWPDISVAKTAVPDADAERTALADDKEDVKLEEAAIHRLATCVTVIQIDGPRRFDPALVSAVRALVASVGPCVFTNRPGSSLTTSEGLLASIKDAPDLASTLKAVAAGELDEDDDLDLGDDEDDLDEDEDDDDDDDDDDEPASDSARPEVLRKILGEIAQHPRARRKAGELLADAPEIVGTFAERLARIGAEPDPQVAKALDVKEKDVVGARKALATILRRAENR